MIRPRKGRTIRIAPPPGQPIRAYIDAVVDYVTPEWVGADVVQESWRFRAGTGLLLRRSTLLELDRQLIAPDAAIAQVYPPETRRPHYAAEVMGRLLGPRPQRGSEGDT